MSIETSTLRPGLLVSLKTSVRGNVSWQKKVIESEHIVDSGEQKARWETVRVVVNPAENEAAKAARGKAAGAIRKVCAQSAFGLLCPEADADKLEAAIAEARKIADDFNKDAKLSRLNVYVMTGRIAPDDVEAVKAINSEVRDLLAAMEQGVKNVDVKVIREAAARAKQLGSMLSADAEARIRIAIDTARNVATRMVKAGEQAAAEVDQSAIRKINEQRTAFLDLDDAQEVGTPAAQGRALDLSPALLPSGAEAPRARPRLDLE